MAFSMRRAGEAIGASRICERGTGRFVTFVLFGSFVVTKEPVDTTEREETQRREGLSYKRGWWTSREDAKTPSRGGMTAEDLNDRFTQRVPRCFPQTRSPT